LSQPPSQSIPFPGFTYYRQSPSLSSPSPYKIIYIL